MRFLDMIFYWAKAKPARPAIIQPDMIITYKELAHAIESVSEHVGQHNLNPREPVAVSIDHAAKRLITCFALLRCGFAVASIHRGLLAHMQLFGIKNLIYDDGDGLPGGNNIRFDDRWLRRVGGHSTVNAVDRSNAVTDQDLIFFTSGTTGRPKKIVETTGAMSERFNLANVTGEANFSRTLIVSGLEGTFAFFSTCAPLNSGHTVCFAPFGHPMLLLVSTYRVEFIIASPQQALALVELLEKTGGYQLDSLKAIRIGGSLVSKDLVRRIQANLCRNVIVSFGSTETGRVAFASYDTIANTQGAAGFVAPWAEVEILDDTGNVLPTGVDGSIRCRTPFFLKNVAASDHGAPNSWWYSGDIGHVTEDGKLCIVGRSDDIINRGGQKISAVDIEETLRSCAGIEDVAVCGVLGPSGLQEVWVGIVPQASLDVEAFLRSLEQDPKLKTKLDTSINQVFVVERIPRTQRGKIQRNELREMLLKKKEAKEAVA